jgi:putative ABC transport system substrate-binding protein
VRGMRDLGYVEGRNIAYEFRHYGDDVESIPSLIGDLLRAKVDIIVVGGTAAIRAAQSATQSIPIVMGAAGDPLESGLIAGLARPGGNTTGLSLLSAELAVKRLEILKQVMTKAARIAILQQPANPAGLNFRERQVHCIRLSHEAPLHLTVQVHAAARATATPWRFRSRRSPSVRMSTAAIRHNAPAAKNAGR